MWLLMDELAKEMSGATWINRNCGSEIEETIIKCKDSLILIKVTHTHTHHMWLVSDRPRFMMNPLRSIMLSWQTELDSECHHDESFANYKGIIANQPRLTRNVIQKCYEQIDKTHRFCPKMASSLAIEGRNEYQKRVGHYLTLDKEFLYLIKLMSLPMKKSFKPNSSTVMASFFIYLCKFKLVGVSGNAITFSFVRNGKCLMKNAFLNILYSRKKKRCFIMQCIFCACSFSSSH